MKVSETILMAMDRAPSVRSRDANGFLHIETSNISKANVCPYLGREIPGAAELGLDLDRVYYLYRDSDELARAKDTFNNLPVLAEHVPVLPDQLPEELIIGSTGTDADFDGTYLRNSLVIWQQAAQDAVEADRKREISCGYRYRADMTPGVTKDGLRYDGVMREIMGNHVALVIEGRAGPDVVVGDEVMKLKSRTALMISGVIQAAVRPLLAADAKVDLASALAGVNGKSAARKDAGATIAAKVAELVTPHLAADAQIDADALAKAIAAVQPLAADEDMIDEDDEDDDKPVEDEGDDADADDMGEDEDEDGDSDEDEKDKPAMDAATVKKLIAAAEARGAARVAAIEVAKKAVFPHVGEVVGMDSAEAIYKLALDAAGVSTKGVHASAFPAMVAMLKKPAEIAQDSRPSFGEPRLAKIIPNLAPVMKG
jgi:hypothetical protein